MSITPVPISIRLVLTAIEILDPSTTF